MTPQYVSEFLKKRAGLLDGVVISGGEPTLQNDLIPFMQMIQGLGYQIKLDTNGSRPDLVEEIINLRLCDYVAVDYKAPAELYPEFCGFGNDADQVIKTIRLLSESDVPFEVRTTVIPQLGTNELVLMAKELPTVPRYVLNRYKVPDKYLQRDEEKILEQPYTSSEIQVLADSIKAWQPNITL